MKIACILSSKTSKEKVTLLESIEVEFIFLVSTTFNIDSSFHARIKLILLFMYADKFLCLQVDTDESSYYKVKITHWQWLFLFLCSHMLQLVLLCVFSAYIVRRSNMAQHSKDDPA